MKNIIATTLLIFILSLYIGACKKYPEGPSFTLRSKKERLANNWAIDKYFINDIEASSYKENYLNEVQIAFGKGGNYSIKGYKKDSAGVIISDIKIYNGIWNFADDNKSFEMLSDTLFAVPEKYTILKLKEKEVRYYKELNGIKYTYYLKPI